MRQELSEIGHDPSGLQVVGRLPILTDSDRTIDIKRTMDSVPGLADAGVTDFRANFSLPDDQSAAAEILSEIVEAFRATVNRPAAG
jgi:hypothetical protein